MKNRKTFAEYWQAIADTLIAEDDSTIETMRHIFIGGAVAYRDLLYRSIPAGAAKPDDEAGWADQHALDQELDDLIDALGPAEEVKH